MHRERVIYMAIKVGMVSLGCAKNQVDGEMLMANLKNAGFELCDDAALADVAIVNTCGFIDSAKQESIDEILELTTLKKEGRIKKIPGVTLRTTLITGFPGETEEEFTELAEFVKDIEFERLGCFAYSQEEGTPAALIPDQIDDEVKNHRAEIIMESQMNIMDRLGEKQVGGDITV